MLFEIIMQTLHMLPGIGPTRSAMYGGGRYHGGEDRRRLSLARTSGLNIGLWHGHKPSTPFPSVGPTADFIESLRLERASASHHWLGKLAVRTVPSDTPLRLALTLLRTWSRLRSRVIGTCRWTSVREWSGFEEGGTYQRRSRFVGSLGTNIAYDSMPMDVRANASQTSTDRARLF